MQGYDDGFGGFAADSHANGPGSEVIGGGVNDFGGGGRGGLRGGLGGAGGCAGGCRCEGGDDDYAFEGLDVGRSDGSQSFGGSGSGGRTEEVEGGSGGGGGGDDPCGSALNGGNVDADADADAGDGAVAIDGLRLAGGGGVAAPVTLDLDEAAAEGRLGVLQWARRATMEASPCACCSTDRENDSGGRSRKCGRGHGSVCRDFGCGRCGPSPALCSGGGDGEEEGEVKEAEHKEEKEEGEKEATGADKVVPLWDWTQDPNGDNQRDQEIKEEEEEAREGMEGDACRLKEGAVPPAGYCSDRRHCCGSVLLPCTAAAPTAVAATRAPTARVSSARVSASSAPLADAAGGGGDGGSSDGAATVSGVGTTTGVGVASTASAGAAADFPATPSDDPGTVASARPVVDGGDAITATTATAGCRGSSDSSGGGCCRCERRVANASRPRPDRNGWRHRGVCQLADDAQSVGHGRRRQVVTDRETEEEVGEAAGGIERPASPPSLGAGINRFRVAFSTAAVDGAAGNGHLEVTCPAVEGGFCVEIRRFPRRALRAIKLVRHCLARTVLSSLLLDLACNGVDNGSSPHR